MYSATEPPHPLARRVPNIHSPLGEDISSHFGPERSNMRPWPQILFPQSRSNKIPAFILPSHVRISYASMKSPITVSNAFSRMIILPKSLSSNHIPDINLSLRPTLSMATWVVLPVYWDRSIISLWRALTLVDGMKNHVSRRRIQNLLQESGNWDVNSRVVKRVVVLIW